MTLRNELLHNRSTLVKSQAIPIHPTKKRYMAICPFHDDHHPSLSVNLEKNVYHCFACGAKGRVDPSLPFLYDTIITPEGNVNTRGNVQVNHIYTKTPNTYMIKSDILGEVYRHRKALPDKRQCGRWIRKGYEGEILKKGVRLLCFEWHCPNCAKRLKAWWLSRVMRESHRICYIVHLPRNLPVDNQLKRLKRLAAKENRRLEYAWLAGGDKAYLFLSGWTAPSTGLLWKVFPGALFLNAFPLPGVTQDILEKALCPEDTPLLRSRKIRISQRFLHSEFWEKAAKKMIDEIRANAGEVKPVVPKLKWVTCHGTLEEIAKEEEVKGRKVTWLSQDYVVFDN